MARREISGKLSRARWGSDCAWIDVEPASASAASAARRNRICRGYNGCAGATGGRSQKKMPAETEVPAGIVVLRRAPVLELEPESDTDLAFTAAGVARAVAD